MEKNIRCPICGKVNKNLILEETDGIFECEQCGNLIDTKQKEPSLLKLNIARLKVETVGCKLM